jgi:hypothetical protein
VDERLWLSVERITGAVKRRTHALHDNPAQAVRYKDDWPLARLLRLQSLVLCVVSSSSPTCVTSLSKHRSDTSVCAKLNRYRQLTLDLLCVLAS